MSVESYSGVGLTGPGGEVRCGEEKAGPLCGVCIESCVGRSRGGRATPCSGPSHASRRSRLVTGQLGAGVRRAWLLGLPAAHRGAVLALWSEVPRTCTLRTFPKVLSWLLLPPRTGQEERMAQAIQWAWTRILGGIRPVCSMTHCRHAILCLQEHPAGSQWVIAPRVLATCTQSN